MVKNPFDAQDLTQETFLSAYKKLPEFDGTYEKAWISRIATNKCLDYLKNAAREIAEESGKNLKTVQTQIYRAKALIKKQMEGGSSK